MKIKHYQGYGSVTATKVSKTQKDGIVTMVIEVSGNHEWGLYRDDVYDCYNWLLSKFDKKVLSYKHILSMDIKDNVYIRDERGVDVEHCTYVFRYIY